MASNQNYNRNRKPTWLNLGNYIPQKDVRKLIYNKLTKYEQYTVALAHNPNYDKKGPKKLCDYAAVNNYLNLLHWAQQTNFKIRPSTVKAAAANARINVLHYLKYRCDKHFSACYAAAESGHLQTLQWLISNDWPLEVEILYNAAAIGGHLHILQWLLETYNEPLRETELCTDAARNGHLHILQWLRDASIHREDVCAWDYETTSAAADGGHLHILQWLRDASIHGDDICPWDSDIYDWAAEGGHSDIVTWIYYNNSQLTPSTYVIAHIAESGDLEMLKWLRNGNVKPDVFPWDDLASAYAAREGHFEILKWMQ